MSRIENINNANAIIEALKLTAYQQKNEAGWQLLYRVGRRLQAEANQAINEVMGA